MGRHGSSERVRDMDGESSSRAQRNQYNQRSIQFFRRLSNQDTRFLIDLVTKEDRYSSASHREGGDTNLSEAPELIPQYDDRAFLRYRVKPTCITSARWKQIQVCIEQSRILGNPVSSTDATLGEVWLEKDRWLWTTFKSPTTKKENQALAEIFGDDEYEYSARFCLGSLKTRVSKHVAGRFIHEVNEKIDNDRIIMDRKFPLRNFSLTVETSR